LKAFILALGVCALALIAGVSAASSASSKQDLLVGYDHAPTAADRAAIANAGGTVRHTFASIGVLAVNLPSGKVSDIRSTQGVSYVEPDAVRVPLSLSSDLLASEYVPSLTNGLYGLVTTHAVEAQAAGFTGAGVKACVADTGLDTHHTDIAPNFVKGYNVFGDASHVNDVDVFSLGVAATETHATHVSGIMLGALNGSGIHGVAPNAKLYEARVLGTQLDGSVSGETSQVMEGVQWLADQGC
jgi:subtilisin